MTVKSGSMASGQWKKPQSIYLKYGSAAIEQENKVMRRELEYINKLKTAGYDEEEQAFDTSKK